MLAIAKNDLFEIFFDSFHIPIGVFSGQNKLEKIFLEGGEQMMRLYLADSGALLHAVEKERIPTICYDRTGFGWGIFPYEKEIVLLGPVQTKHNRNYLYRRVPEHTWDSFQAIANCFGKLLLGKEVKITENRGQLAGARPKDEFFKQNEGESYQWNSYDELYDCIKKGDPVSLGKILASEELHAYLDKVIIDRKTAERVFQFGFARAYHSAQEVCGATDELIAIYSSYMNGIADGRYDASSRATFQNMLYDFAQYVCQYKNRGYSRVVNKALSYINKNLYTYISLQDLSAYCMVGVSTLQHQIKKETGKTVTDLIREKKMERACFYLNHTNLPCTDIALKLHYSAQSHFISQFKKEKGMSPMQYRKAGQEHN